MKTGRTCRRREIFSLKKPRIAEFTGRERYRSTSSFLPCASSLPSFLLRKYARGCLKACAFVPLASKTSNGTAAPRNGETDKQIREGTNISTFLLVERLPPFQRANPCMRINENRSNNDSVHSQFTTTTTLTSSRSALQNSLKQISVQPTSLLARTIFATVLYAKRCRYRVKRNCSARGWKMNRASDSRRSWAFQAQTGRTVKFRMF